MVGAIFWLVGEIIHLLILAIIAAAVVNTLIAFGVVNTRNQIVYSIADFLNRLTDPVLRPIRRYLPAFGNVDISPVIAILLLASAADGAGRYLCAFDHGGLGLLRAAILQGEGLRF